MVEFIFDEDQEQKFTDTTIIVNKSSSLNNVLSLLQANTLSFISLNFIKNPQTLTDLKLANNLGRVLKEEGKILIKLIIKDVSESDMAFFQVIYAGSSLKENMRDKDSIELQKNTPKIHSLKSRQTKEYTNVYGDYDYKTQNIKQLVKVNPFQQFNQNESEQIDEEQLLNDNIQIKQVDACATKAKACKNCSCGKKEVEEAQDKTQLLTELQQGTIKSSCGSCYLGDAFRCATCPYKGLPAFKQDGKVQINNIDDQNLQVENKQTLVQNGKVRLQI